MITNHQLEGMVAAIRPQLDSGTVSSYLPSFSTSHPRDFAVSIHSSEGQVLSYGPTRQKFTVQSIVKVFTLLLAIEDWGPDTVFSRVGYDQETSDFNSLEAFSRTTGLPANPFVNSGAFAVLDLLRGDDSATKVGRILDLVRGLTDDPTITVNAKVAHEELERSDRNRAICYYMRSNGLLDAQVDSLLEAYCQVCSIEVSAEDLARAGNVLANADRIDHVSGLPRPASVRLTSRLLLSTGMYAGSGWYAANVGIPAKCGVSGGTMGMSLDRGGIGVYGPALDATHNSLGGVKLMEALSDALDL